MLSPAIKEEVTGNLEVLETFKIPRWGLWDRKDGK